MYNLIMAPVSFTLCIQGIYMLFLKKVYSALAYICDNSVGTIAHGCRDIRYDILLIFPALLGVVCI